MEFYTDWLVGRLKSIVLEPKQMSSKVDSNPSNHLQPIIVGGLVLASLLGILLTLETPNENFGFLVNQLLVLDVGINLTYLMITCVGFIYYFIVPGLPFLTKTASLQSINGLRLLLFGVLYSVSGCYLGLLFLMIMKQTSLVLLLPLLLLGLGGLLSKFVSVNDEEDQRDSAFEFIQQRRYLITIVLIVFISFFIRFVIMSNLLVEYTDGLQYHRIIIDIGNESFIFNPEHAVWAPLYPLLGFGLSGFNGNPFFALKSISMIFSFIMLLPVVIVTLEIYQNHASRPKALPTVIVATCAYPWLNVFSVMNLQDMMLTFFVAAFVAMIFSDAFHAGAGIAAGLAFLSRYSLGVLGPIGLLYLILRHRNSGWKGIQVYLITWIVLVGTWIARNLSVAGVLFSLGDEGLISPGNALPNLGIAGEFGLGNPLNPLGLVSIIISVPLVFGAIMLFKTDRRRWSEFWSDLFSHRFAFLYTCSILQIITLLLFTMPQMRFLLSIIWIAPLFWFYLVHCLNLDQKNILLAGWVVWGFIYSFFLFRTYGYLENSRLPVQTWDWTYYISAPPVPTPEIWMLTIACASLLVSVVGLVHVLRKR